MMESLLQDVKFGFRLMLKNRVLTAITVLAMALGIGASSSTFSVINSIFFRPLPFKAPDRIVQVFETNPRLIIDHSEVTGPDYLDWRAQNQVFDSLAAVFRIGFNLSGEGGEPESVPGAKVSPSFFQIFDIQPVAGRTFLPEEELPASCHVVLISKKLWQRRFSSDLSVIGKTITVDDQGYTVVGIMPDNPQFPAGTEIWRPLPLEGEVTGNRFHHNLAVFGRLRAGIPIELARTEMSTIAQRLEQEYPTENRGVGAAVVSLPEELFGSTKYKVLVLFGVSFFVLLIACASLGNLLLARAATRQKEIAIRAALGASRAGLVRQLLTESIMLALLGGALGLLLAFGGTSLLSNFLPWNVSTVINIGVNYQVLAFALVISILTGIVFGLVPALKTTAPNLSTSLQEARGAATSGFSVFHRHNSRSLLVISELALTLILLIAAGLMLRSFLKLRNVELGFDPHNVVSLSVYLPHSKYPEPEKMLNFFEQALKNVQLQPGVQSAALISTLPMGGFTHTTRFEIKGHETADGQGYETSLHRISTDYFRTMNIPVKKGRVFTEQDYKGQPVAIVNETMARRFFAGMDPIGQQVRAISTTQMQPWVTVIGVVGDVKHWGVSAPMAPEGYILFEVDPRPLMTMVVRTNSNPTTAVKDITAKIHEIDKDLPVQNVRTMDQLITESVTEPRQYMFIIGTFAVVALILAAIGVYGVLSYLVAQRTNEVGIRMALGAQRKHVISLILGQATILVAVGAGAGLLGAYTLTRLMANLLFEVSTVDPTTFVVIPLVLAGVALLASYIPALRATKIDPMTAIRNE